MVDPQRTGQGHTRAGGTVAVFFLFQYCSVFQYAALKALSHAGNVGPHLVTQGRRAESATLHQPQASSYGTVPNGVIHGVKSA
ncbi:hypothetical protein BDW42DRAFT_169077 [Aspergillus taichungensis]|uniref:Uncharacterized protein n=1 Tax=Aspergillus taichungensis TaxID=482145 RepID=A0A2J5HVM0_9EURO|nr:hypothetical protein BDW42DRAFT_169077 [Aspergillus taichungensis]